MKILFATTILLLLSVFVCGQDCDHTSNSFRRFDNTRLLPMVKITVVDFTHIKFDHQEASGILTLDKETVGPAKFTKGFYWILYCLKCKHVYTIVDVQPEQIKRK
jgi:hypothetical protein